MEPISLADNDERFELAILAIPYVRKICAEVQIRPEDLAGLRLVLNDNLDAEAVTKAKGIRALIDAATICVELKLPIPSLTVDRSSNS